jgi:aconitate hydratase
MRATRAALVSKDHSGHIVVGGANYGQGSPRSIAAIAPRYLGLRAVLAVRHHSQAIHRQTQATWYRAGVHRSRRLPAVQQGDVLLRAQEGIRDTLGSDTGNHGS